VQAFKVDANSKYIDKIKNIYLNAFPPDERLDFDDLISNKIKNGILYALFDNNLIVGFSFVISAEDFVYILYLAIDDKFRNKGYGTKTLNIINDTYKNQPKVLCVEEPETANDMRSRRIEFYERNGFVLSNVKFTLYNTQYKILHTRKIDMQNFINFMLKYFPDCKDFKYEK